MSRLIEYPLAFGLPPRADALAWVYILAFGGNKCPVKVGCAVDLAARFKKWTRTRPRAYPVEFWCAYQLPYTLVTGGIAARVEYGAHYGLREWAIGNEDLFLVSPAVAEETVVRAIKLEKCALVRFPEAGSAE